MFRDQDSYRGQKSYHGKDAETETHLPAVVEGQSLIVDVKPLSTEGDDDDVEPAPRRVSLWPAFGRRTLIATAAAIAIMVAGGVGAHWWISGRYMVSTDDAYVGAHNTTLASKISGYVASIPVNDNATVHAGDVIATIDNGDYQLAVDAAREKAATQQATVDRIGRQVVAQQANVDQTKAQMLSAQAEAKKTQLEFDRQQALAAQRFASQQTLEQAIASRDQAAAAISERAGDDRGGRGQSRRAEGAATRSLAHVR